MTHSAASIFRAEYTLYWLHLQGRKTLYCLYVEARGDILLLPSSG
jgi:hypothetical protein